MAIDVRDALCRTGLDGWRKDGRKAVFYVFCESEKRGKNRFKWIQGLVAPDEWVALKRIRMPYKKHRSWAVLVGVVGRDLIEGSKDGRHKPERDGKPSSDRKEEVQKEE